MTTALCVAATLVALWLYGQWHRAQRLPATLEVDAERVVMRRGRREAECVAWADLGEVWIVTTDAGPALDDVFFVLVARGAAHGCVVPQSVVHGAPNGLLDRLLALRGFDHALMARAMGSTDNARFVVWRATGAAPS